MIVLFALVAPAHVAGQTPPTGNLWVTYVNVTPTTTDTGKQIDIVFRVVYFTCDPYLGSIANPADGIKTATFLLVSVETQQSNRYPDTPVFPTGGPGEYRADIQIVPEDPTGKVWVYVEGKSLNSRLSTERTGAARNTASEQTYDTSDMSLIQIGQPPPAISFALRETVPGQRTAVDVACSHRAPAARYLTSGEAERQALAQTMNCHLSSTGTNTRRSRLFQ